MQRLARDFGISDVGLAKTCKRYNIPRPERGHWQRIAAGQRVKRPKLPPPPTGSKTITFSIPEPKIVDPVAAEEILMWTQRERDPANKIVVPEVVHSFHPLLRDTKERSAKDAAAIYVDQESWPRARRLWHALAVALEERGFRIGPRDSWDRSTVTILGETVSLAMDERTKRVERTVPTPQHRCST